MYFGYFDGACKGNPGVIGMGAIIYNGADHEADIRVCYMEERGTNNIAEYKALIALLELAVEYKIKKLKVFGDSKLIIAQVNGEWKVKNAEIKKLYEKVLGLIGHFDFITFRHIRREKNKVADSLANQAIRDRILKNSGGSLDNKIKSPKENTFTVEQKAFILLIEEATKIIQESMKILESPKSRNTDSFQEKAKDLLSAINKTMYINESSTN